MIFYLLSLILHGLFAFLLTAYLRSHQLRRLRRRSFPRRELLLCLFCAYLWVGAVTLLTPNALLSVTGVGVHETFSSYLGGLSDRLHSSFAINLVPFKTIRNYHRYSTGLGAWLNLWGNILLFFPFGAGLTLFWHRFASPLKVLLLGSCSSALIEGMQFFIGRSVDIDDLLLNALGALLGSLTIRILLRLFPTLGRYRR